MTAASNDYERLSELFNLPRAGFRNLRTEDAMKIAVVYACVRLISGAIAQMPVKIYRRKSDGSKSNPHPQLEKMLNLQPDPLFSGPAFMEFIVSGILLHGYAFGVLQRDRNGRLRRLTPVHPSRVGMRTNRENTRVIYTIMQNGTAVNFDQDDILHFHNFGFDGLRAPSVISAGANHATGIADAMEEFTEDFFENGALQSYAIIKDGNWTTEQRQAIRDQWQERYSKGISSRNIPIVFDRTVDVKQLTMNSRDAQLLEAREFQITDIARAFGLPSFMINQEQKSTSWGTGVAEIGNVFLRYTLMPHISRIEAEFNRKMFLHSPDYIKLDASQLIRASQKERYAAYRGSRGRILRPRLALDQRDPRDGRHGSDLWR